MAGKKRRDRADSDPRPIVVDDFIYNDPDGLTGSDSAASDSDTPDEAMRKLRGRRREESAAASPEEPESPPSENTDSSAPGAGKGAPSGRKVYSTGVILDEDLQPVDAQGRRPRKEHRVRRGVILTLITVILLLTIASYILHRIAPDYGFLGAPESLISRIVTPVQSLFSGLSESVAGYFRSMKLRANLESEYNRLREEN